jgi:glutathione synthase/RimK-type ligase-like ATP-grasp enzyme
LARIGVYIERYTVTRSEEMDALLRFGQVARRLGHDLDYLFRPDIYKIPQYDAIFIRSLTDPLNASYVASRMAELHGIRVVDDSESIRICCDKVNVHRHLIDAGLPVPKTVFIESNDLNPERGTELLDILGSPVVLKAPNSSFSMYVERVSSAEELIRVGRRFLRRADRLVAQSFVVSSFDWRVGVLGGKPLYVCRYTIPRKRWKVLTYVENGRTIYGPVKGMEVEKSDPHLLDTAVRAASAIGKGLYGVDLKQQGDDYMVIEVNDNPTVAAGEEDQKAPNLYEKVIRHLADDYRQ